MTWVRKSASQLASSSWYPNVWDFPGGHVEAGEDEPSALRRELSEEIGVRALVLDERPFALIHARRDDMRLSIWIVRAWDGPPTSRSPDEHDELRWASFEQAGSLALAHRTYLRLLHSLLTRGLSG